MNYNDLKNDKIRLRKSNPELAGVIETILVGAERIAKKENREVTEPDLILSVRKSIKESENAIDLIKKGNGNPEKWEKEVSILRTFLPVGMNTEQMKIEAEKILSLSQDKTMKGLGSMIKIFKEQNPDADMGEVSKVFRSLIGGQL